MYISYCTAAKQKKNRRGTNRKVRGRSCAWLRHCPNFRRINPIKATSEYLMAYGSKLLFDLRLKRRSSHENVCPLPLYNRFSTLQMTRLTRFSLEKPIYARSDCVKRRRHSRTASIIADPSLPSAGSADNRTYTSFERRYLPGHRTLAPLYCAALPHSRATAIQIATSHTTWLSLGFWNSSAFRVKQRWTGLNICPGTEPLINLLKSVALVTFPILPSRTASTRQL